MIYEVKLLTNGGFVNNVARVHSKPQVKQQIEAWRSLYGEGMEKCMIQIYPIPELYQIPKINNHEKDTLCPDNTGIAQAV